MANAGENKLTLNHIFDGSTKRHYINGHLVVLHCHHYATLYTQLAMDAEETQLLATSAEEAFYELLVDYFNEHNISDREARIGIARQYFSMVGLGTITVTSLSETGGEIELPTSHVDAGWLKKWGKYEHPVNFIGAGYLTAMFSAVLDKPLCSFEASEKQSIVMGAETSIFNVAAR